MARLTIEQVQAPDFSASSQMLARAGESFNSGMESAKGILSSYNEGQQAKDDNIVLNEFAKAGSVDDLNKLLGSDMLLGLNISDSMKKYVAGMRTELIGNDSTRAGTEATRDSTTRANAAEGRMASEYGYGVQQRDALASLTPAVLEAEREGRANGSNAMGGEGISNDPEWQKENLTTIRSGNGQGWQVNKLAADAFSGFLGELEATGYGLKSSGGFNYRNIRGSTKLSEHASGLAIDLNADTNQLGSEKTDLPPNVSEIAAKYGLKWGGDFKGRKDPMHFEFIGGGNNAPITSVPTGGQASQALQTLLGTSGLPPDVALKILQGSFTAQKEGDAQITAAEALRQSEAMAAAQVAALQDPTKRTEADFQMAGLGTQGVSSSNQLAAGIQGSALAGQFSGLINPVAPADTELQAAADRLDASKTAAAGENVFSLAASFNGGPNTSPIGPLFKELGIDTTGTVEEVNSYDNALSGFAEAAGVTPSEAAAALATIDRKNGIDVKEALKLAPDQEGYGTIVSLIDKAVGSEAKTAYETSQIESSKLDAERESAQLQFDTLRNKAVDPRASEEERVSAQRQADTIKESLIKGMTPKQREQKLVDYMSKSGSGSLIASIQADIAKYPKGTPKGDSARADFEKTMLTLVQQVEQDAKNGILTEGEKELLLKDIKG